MQKPKSLEPENSSHLEMLIHGEGAAISASIHNTLRYYTEVLPFKDWRTDFSNGLESLHSEDLLRATEFENQFDSIIHQYGGEKDLITESPEYHNLINKIRGTGVQRRWDYERFISENTTKDSHEPILGYFDSKNDYHNWTPNDYQAMASGNRIAVEPGENLGKRFIIEGHHGRSISQTPYDDMVAMYDPDNIRLYTPKGHQQIGHAGNWQNSGDEPYTDITDRADSAIQAERRHYSSSSDLDEQLAVALGILGGSISGILKYIQLSKDPLPWNRRKYLSLAGAFASGAATGTIPYIVILAAKDPLSDIIDNGLAEIFHNGQTLVQDSMLDSLADASGSFSLIMSAIVVRTLLQSGFQCKQYGSKNSAENFCRTIGRASLEQGAFFGLHILLEPFVPGIVLGLRITYSLVKINLSIEQQKCLVRRRIDALHDVAYAAIAK